MIRFASVPVALEHFVRAWQRRAGERERARERVSIREATVRARAVVLALDDLLIESALAAARAETAPAQPSRSTRSGGLPPELRASLTALRGDLRQLDALAADEARQAHEWTRRAGLAREEGRAQLVAAAHTRQREHVRFAEALAVEAHEVARTVSTLEQLFETPPAER